MTWSLIGDSGCDMVSTDLQTDAIRFITVPLKIIIAGKEYVDDDALDTAALLNAMNAEKTASSTACPSPEDFAAAFLQSDCSICITITSKLSGTYNCACVARDLVLEQHPEKKIHVINSAATSGKLGLVLHRAKEYIEQGMSFEEIVPLLDAYNAGTRLVFALGSYENLVKTGRMSRIAGILATHLGIRAVATNTPDGAIEVVKKPRGEEKAIEFMVDMVAHERPAGNSPIIISHCHNESGAVKLREALAERLGTDNIRIYSCKGLCTFYTMRRGLMIAY